MERAWDRAARSDGPGDPPAALTLALGFTLAAGGDPDRADDVLCAGLGRAHAAGDSLGAVVTRVGLGWIANQGGRHDTAAAHLEAALALVPSVPDPRRAVALTGTVLTNLGTTARGRGQLPQAAAYHEHALRLQREAGHPFGVIHNLVDLGLVARDRGDAGIAGDRFREGLRLAWRHGERRYVVAALEGLACIHAGAGEAARAARTLGVVQRLRDLVGMTEDAPVDRAARERASEVCRDALGEDGFAAAWTAGRSLDLEQAIAGALEGPQTTAERPPMVALTPREQEMLPLLVPGLSDRQIAEALFIGERTVESHVARIYTKLGVRSRAAAVAAAITAGLVEPPPPSPPAG